MAFNMSAFLGGAAIGVVDRIEDMERKAEKKADRAYTVSEKDRLYNRAKRDKEKAITDELADSLSVYYTPDQVEDIMKNGKGASRYAVGRGEYYANNGMDASVAYQMPDNDITDIGGAAVGSVGDVAASSEALSTGAPEGLGGSGGSFASRFTKGPDAKDKSLAAAETDVLNMRIRAATLSEEAGAKLLEKADAKENILLDMQRKKADAQREAADPNEIQTFYTVDQRLKIEKKYDTLALNEMGVETGTLGELGSNVAKKLRGSNTIAISQLRSAESLHVSNTTGNKEEYMYDLIEGKKVNAVNRLNQYAKTNYSKVPSAKIYQSSQDLQNAGRSGALREGDLYITFVKAHTIQAKTMPDGSVVPEQNVPAQYMAGTYIGDIYKNLGLKSYIPAGYLGETWKPTVETP
jgi:hypothetical protein